MPNLSTSDKIFHKENEIIKKNKKILLEKKCSLDELYNEFSLLDKHYNRLLKQTMRTTKLADATHRDILNANERIGMLNSDLLKQKEISEAAEVELAQINHELALAAEQESVLRAELQESHDHLTKAKEYMESELNMARQIQEHLLPLTPPKIQGVKIYSHYSALDEIGGDFLDYTLNREGSVGILVADASGHGVPAALVGSISKMFMDSQREKVSHSNEILKNLNGALCGKIRHNFVTACYAILDVENLKFSYSISGHPPPYLIRKNKVTRLKGKGRPLGIFPEVAPAEITIDLNFGDKILILTDGVLECRSREGEELKEATMIKFLSTLTDSKPETFLDDLLTLLMEYTGDRGFEDDATLVLLCMDNK